VACRVEIKSSARRELRSLPAQARRRVDAAILTLAENPRPPRAKKLAVGEDLYRVRVGDYRIIYQVREKVLLVLIVKVGHRKDVYGSL